MRTTTKHVKRKKKYPRQRVYRLHLRRDGYIEKYRLGAKTVFCDDDMRYCHLSDGRPVERVKIDGLDMGEWVVVDKNPRERIAFEEYLWRVKDNKGKPNAVIEKG